MIGHGQSDNRSGMDSSAEDCPASQRGSTLYTLEHFALETAEALELLGVRRFALLGHSMGASIALLLAVGLGPEQVSSLVMLDSLGPRPVSFLLFE